MRVAANAGTSFCKVYVGSHVGRRIASCIILPPPASHHPQVMDYERFYFLIDLFPNGFIDSGTHLFTQRNEPTPQNHEQHRALASADSTRHVGGNKMRDESTSAATVMT